MTMELLRQIECKLNEKGFMEYSSEDVLSNDQRPFAIGQGLLDQFEWLPEENLRKIAKFDISGYTSFEGVYQAWGNHGFFKFTPYITEKGLNPTMVLKHNKFLHMFRGYRFQISETYDGIGVCNTSSFNTQTLRKLIKNNPEYTDSHLLFLLMYSAMIDCGFQNDNFRYAFYDHRDVIDRFFKKSMKYWGTPFKYDSSLLQQYISYRADANDRSGEDGYVYEITSKGKPVCRFYTIHDELCIEYNPTLDVKYSRVVSFDIPAPTVGIPQSVLDGMPADAIKTFMSKYRRGNVKPWFLAMMLKLVGVHTGFDTTYPIKKIGVLPEYFEGVLQPYDNLTELIDNTKGGSPE